MDFLSILRGAFLLCYTYESSKFVHATSFFGILLGFPHCTLFADLIPQDGPGEFPATAFLGFASDYELSLWKSFDGRVSSQSMTLMNAPLTLMSTTLEPQLKK